MTKHRAKPSPGMTALIIIFGLFDLVVLIGLLIQGKNVALFNPKGFIAHEQFNLMVFIVGLLLTVTALAIFVLYFIAWKYRESNTQAAFEPDKKHGKWFNFSVWAFPTTIMLILAAVMIPATQQLVPQKLISADAEPITIQVISLRWKWLFIYPEQKIATVNYVQIPLNTPVQFELTADTTPMSSFWIPNLGGQLYTMTGHVNRLNLIAGIPGSYPGSSAEINGAGFAGMKFTAQATYSENFYQWVDEVKQSPEALDSTTYENLLKPSEDNPVTFYSHADTGIFDSILAKYMGSHETSDKNEHVGHE